jgi:hypothetical protein
MLALMPHAPGMAQLTSDVTVTNPLQGILYHFIMSSFLCYGCEHAMIPLLPGLSTAQGTNGGQSQCAKVKLFSERKLTELRKACADRGLAVLDYNTFYFTYHPTPGSLRGDKRYNSSANEKEAGASLPLHDQEGGEFEHGAEELSEEDT